MQQRRLQTPCIDAPIVEVLREVSPTDLELAHPASGGAIGDMEGAFCRGPVQLSEQTDIVRVFGLFLVTRIRVHTHSRCIAQCSLGQLAGPEGWVRFQGRHLGILPGKGDLYFTY